MGLFDPKYCSLCGNKLGLLGNTHLADGYLCKNCSSQLSPLLTNTRKRTLDDIKKHLEYREQNALLLNDFEPTHVFGGRKKIYIDTNSKRFLVTSYNDYRKAGADIIPFSQVYEVENSVREDRDEETYKNADGKYVSYDPPRYTYEYTMKTDISVNSPWFNKISLELSDKERPAGKWNELYTDLDLQQRSIKSILLGKPLEPARDPETGNTILSNNPAVYPANNTYTAPVNTSANTDWICPKCGSTNNGNFCGNCGCKRPTYVCPRCGFTHDYKVLPRFCSNCGCELNNY